MVLFRHPCWRWRPRAAARSGSAGRSASCAAPARASSSPAAAAAAPAPEPLEPAIPVHRLPQRRRGRSPAAAWACSCFRAAGRASWGPPWALGHYGLSRPGRGSCGKIPSRSSSGPAAAPPASSASDLLVIRHFRFSSSSPSSVWVEEEGEGDTGSSDIHLVPIYVGQFAIQRSERDRAAQLHQMPVVRQVLHDVARMCAALPSSLDRR